jgi:A/G-specific adenine glycosylase
VNSRFFSEKLVEWYHDHHRDLPWRNTQEPYKIWLSEIILQQTRVIQGLPYYKKFIKKYPNINFLARASEREVLRLWQGLGYYTRARNLHKCAKVIVKNYGGEFPPEFRELKKLPGIGDYTAAAVASFAFQEPVAVVDGNVYRVLSRVFGIHHDVGSAAGKKYFAQLANRLVSSQDPGSYNQAIMEFGAMQCVPKNPDCDGCIFKKNCFAFQRDQQDTFPVKKKPKKSKHRYFYYFVLSFKGKILMNRRSGTDIWKGLYDFPLHEEKKSVDPGKVIRKIFDNHIHHSFSEEYKHILTHRIIHARFIRLEISDKMKFPSQEIFADARGYSPIQMMRLPKPVLISRYLEGERIL